MAVGQRVGGFRLVRQLGAGGFGTVHLGEDAAGRRAAVKLLHPHLAQDPQVRRYFVQELATARTVQGFCLAAIVAADAAGERPWIATEYVDGPTLDQAVREHGPRTGGDVQRLAVQTITALAAIHAAGVVHRDLKPANILLGPDGARVIDFGIARALDAGTASATRIGTLGYMAPEQVEGTALGPAADLFAWGAVMIHAATGAEAFPGPTQAARIHQVLTHPPQTGDLADPLLGIVLACTAKDPAHRPTARQVLDMLLTGRTTPPPDTEQTRRYTADETVPEPDPALWDSSATDPTPFTADALLPQRFTTDNAIAFARVATGARPCTKAATGKGGLTAEEVIEEITARGCTQVMTGVYVEQPGPRATPGNPVQVSVMVLPFPDTAAARDARDYLSGPARWHLTTWREHTGPGTRPMTPHIRYYRWSHNRLAHRYVVTVMAHRTDLTTDGGIKPWLESAAAEACRSSGPQNHRGP
ncbi:serine/threonine protein kinase [Murinocardiopsis flavida]|uniref:non-specific serine/threonine protein kinase n=1 Tax=Murinocardiopsis flavida TaxID=645275 RepID=A0A2P8DP20_9ACTN|nr:serine/threonine-protein kinase [Murinocardiopsis flavida]PSK98967.1 serine/threonine protein kinase [Murinocardiopsis flavida]